MSIGIYSEYGLCTVAVSEGIQDDQGSPIAVTLLGAAERDAHGNVQLSGSGVVGDLLAAQVKSKLEIEARSRGHLRLSARSFLGVGSDRDAHEAREVGEIAVQYTVGQCRRIGGHSPSGASLQRFLRSRSP